MSNTKTESTSSFHLVQHNIYPTHVVGAWVVDSQFRVALTKKPNWFHRLMVRMLLGWKYEYVTDTKSTTTRQLLNG